MIIDFHTHIFPDSIAEYAINKLSAMGGIKAHGLATEDDLERKMNESGVDYSVILSIATKTEQVEVINRYNISRKNPKLVFFGAMHQDYPDYEREIDFIYRNGIRGIKMHPEFQNFLPSDKKLFPLYKALSDRNMIILFHSGKEEFVKKEYYNSHPEQFSIVHETFPDLKMILAHLGGHDMIEEAVKYILGKNIYVDISYDLSEKNLSLLNTLLKYHNEDLILYGSDWPWKNLDEYLTLIKSAEISENIMKKILGINAFNLLKSVNECRF